MHNSAIYTGNVMHMRLRPKRHRLNYRVFSLLLDIDELVELDGSMRLFGYNRRALVSFHDKDHGNGSPHGLRDWIEEKLGAAGLLQPKMRISILCYPRIFGYVFNPLTLYFCYGADGKLQAILYEVANTFNERHTYIIAVSDVPPEQDNPTILQSCAKDFYVSPFMPMNCFYHFHIEPPQEKLLIRINETDPDGLLLIASFAAQRGCLTDQSLGKALLKHPLMTLKITAGIYWEALRLWGKGVPIYRHKAAAKPVGTTVINPLPTHTQTDELKLK